MVSRRTVIASAVGVSTVAALAACAPQVATQTQSSTSPTPTPEASSVAGVEVCKTTDIPVGSGKRFDVEGVPILITQPTKGVFRGFSAVCTHAGFVMSTVANSEITCENHGAVYNADNGSVIKGPAPRALGNETPKVKIAIEVQGESVLVKLIEK
jgi:nitrite reductase/ring-hydroxylating ferredoxin subunit